LSLGKKYMLKNDELRLEVNMTTNDGKEPSMIKDVSTEKEAPALINPDMMKQLRIRTHLKGGGAAVPPPPDPL